MAKDKKKEQDPKPAPETPKPDTTQTPPPPTSDDEDDRRVTSKELDPTAKAALTDLLGKGPATDSKVLSSVRVYSPFRVYYDNQASSVSAVNGTGPFDVLPGHKNFLSLLSPGDITVRSISGKEETITIDRGVMHVHDDQVQVFLDV